MYWKKIKTNDISSINFRRKSCNTLLFGGIHPFEKITFNLNFNKDYLQEENDINANANENEKKIFNPKDFMVVKKRKKKKQVKQLKIIPDIEQLKS